MKNMALLTVIIIGVLAMGYFLAQRNKDPLTPVGRVETPLPTTSDITSPSPPTAGETALRAGGSSLADPKGVFTILYPADYQFDSDGDGQHLRLFKTGPSQRGQTEMYDGVIMVFESLNIEGKTLEQWVDETIATSTTDGTLEVTKPKTAITIHGYPGFAYTTRGLGESTNIVVQKNPTSSSAVHISMAVHDPQQQGFQEQVDDILSTLEILK